MDSHIAANQPLTLNVEKYFRLAQIASLLMLGGAAAGFFFENPILLGFSLAFFIVALICTLVTWLTIRPARRAVQAVARDYFARWTYDVEEWNRHLDQEKKHHPHYLRTYLILGAIFGFLCSASVAVISLLSQWSPSFFLFAIIFFSWVTLCVIIGLALDAAHAWRQNRVRRSGGLVYIGKTGLYYGGDFWPSRQSNPKFLGIRYEANSPGSLVFAYYIFMLKGGSHHQDVRVPIPRGKEKEVETVVAQVKAVW